ncbi:hypothetical protein B0X71_13200 [Planococcus lenghuensis]|uniref:Uncharacterized protein n=1 Tax=Planococcus lenghuensis TaxID=2213202 RepID=A0A1Q2L0H2_9BACL|nr:hypothetical protein B0X71_13200 [Planococcus lenghuensis]
MTALSKQFPFWNMPVIMPFSFVVTEKRWICMRNLDNLQNNAGRLYSILLTSDCQRIQYELGLLI